MLKGSQSDFYCFGPLAQPFGGKRVTEFTKVTMELSGGSLGSEPRITDQSVTAEVMPPSRFQVDRSSWISVWMQLRI